jgi:hypothetical protein
LLTASDFTFIGSFRVPPSEGGEQTPSFGGTALAYWPAHDSLLMVGHDHHQRVTEFSIPDPVIADAIADLPQATQLQPYVDLLAGKLYTVDGGTGNGVKIGGITPRGDDESLIVSTWTYYDNAQPPQMLTHFHVGTWDWSTLTPDDVRGPFQVGQGFEGIIEGTVAEQQKRIGGFVSGYMCVIPPEWQPAFGATRLTGQGGGVSILTRTSSGPSCSAFDITPDGQTDPVPAAMLMGYPSDSANQGSDFHHPTLGTWGEDGSGRGLYNGTQTFRGMVFPDGKRSVLFIGWRGSQFCYGAGTSDESLHLAPIDPPQYDAEGELVHYCYDPAEPSKGTHGYPNEPVVYAYDANELLAVQAGTKKPWDIVPYATWKLTYPFLQNFPNAVKLDPYMTMGAAWNPNRRWLFVSGYRQDSDAPLIHVYQVA